MEYDQIKKLMDDMGNSKLTDVSIEFPDGIKIKMKKDFANVQQQEKIIEKTIDVQPEKQEEKFKIVKSPMVGTFYAKPSPDSNPYVHIGQNIKKGEILCIVEAMKLLNEIESDFDGVIEEILVKDGESVDFGKPLFKIKSEK